MEKKEYKVAVYIRIGNLEKNRDDLEIELQKNCINHYLDERLKEIFCKEYYIDNGFSGTTYKRPEFERMLNDISENKINTIIVKDLARFSRVSNALYKIEELKKKYNIHFISVVGGLDTINKSEEFNQILNIYNMMKKSHNESIRISKRFKKEKMKG